MSERKSAEVKFRCTPTFKAELAAAADAAGETLSEYIGRSVWARQNQTIDGTGLTAIASLHERGAGESGLMQFIRTNVVEPQRKGEPRDNAWSVFVEDAVNADGCEKNCRAWEFCACKAGA